MLAKNSINKKISDKTFIAAKKARLAVLKYGKENVVNTTLGILYNELEEIYTFNVVDKEYRKLSSQDLYGYASSITGDENFKNSVRKIVLGKNIESNFHNIYTDVISTPGGTGAIYNTIKNYMNYRDKILLPDYMWASYKLIVGEAGGGYECYSLFDEDNNFNMSCFEKKVFELSKTQKNLVIVINDPCHNPTGYSLTEDEWKKIMLILKNACEKTNIILLNDIAYRDFDDKPVEFKNIFVDIPENLLIIIAFSMSKSFCSYGLRVGAQLAMSSSIKRIEEFSVASAYTCRGIWSNVSRAGMEMLSNIVLDEKKYLELKFEISKSIDLLKERSEIFINESKKIGLKILPYKNGFFITVPFDKKIISEVTLSLEEKNIFALVMEEGIRIAICSIPKNKIKGLAYKLKEILKRS
ncbi:MAG: pyridoxal phosphate-dependent aminotransferase [Fusobacteriaceae bacterium]